MRDFRGTRNDPERDRFVQQGVHFRGSSPCCSGAMIDPVGQVDRDKWRPLRRQGSRCGCALRWTAAVRWQTTNAQEGSARRSRWTRGSAPRPETEAGVPRQRLGCTCSPLPVFWFSILLCISLPLRRASICGHLQFGSIEPDHLRTYGRQGAESACICGHEKGPAGHLAAAFSGLSDAFFGLADMGYFGVAPDAAHPCVGHDRRWIDRRVMDETQGST